MVLQLRILIVLFVLLGIALSIPTPDVDTQGKPSKPKCVKKAQRKAWYALHIEENVPSRPITDADVSTGINSARVRSMTTSKRRSA